MAFYIPLELIYIHKQNRHDISAMLRSYHEMRFSPLAFIWKNAYVHASKMRMEVPKWQSCLRSYIKRNSISLIAINGLEWNLISKISSTVYLFENYKSGKNLLRYSSTTTKYALLYPERLSKFVWYYILIFLIIFL